MEELKREMLQMSSGEFKKKRRDMQKLNQKHIAEKISERKLNEKES